MKKHSNVFVFGKEEPVVQAGPGITRKVLSYSDNMMICEIRLEKGAVLPAHIHPHEQSTTVLSGKLAYTVADETKEVQDGDSVWLAPNVPHGVSALEDTLVIDVFVPLREDFLP